MERGALPAVAALTLLAAGAPARADESRLADLALALHCAPDVEAARAAVWALLDAPRSVGGLPDETLGDERRRPRLSAETLGRVLLGLDEAAETFAALREEASRALLSWSYCAVDSGGRFWDLESVADNLGRHEAPPLSPLALEGYRRWGLAAAPARRVPWLLAVDTLGPELFPRFVHAVVAERCFPHPVSGERPGGVAPATGNGDGDARAWGACPVAPPSLAVTAPSERALPSQAGPGGGVGGGAGPPPLVVMKGAHRGLGVAGSVYLGDRLVGVESVGVRAQWVPWRFAFVRAGVEWAFDGPQPSWTYTWGFGYDDWHPGTFSLQVNNWIPTPFDRFDWRHAEVDLGYKLPFPSTVGEHLAGLVRLNAPLAKRPGLALMLTWRIYASLFVMGGLRLAPFDDDVLTFIYGLGWWDWRAYTFSLTYYNWGPNPAFAPNPIRNGVLTFAWSWAF